MPQSASCPPKDFRRPLTFTAGTAKNTHLPQALMRVHSSSMARPAGGNAGSGPPAISALIRHGGRGRRARRQDTSGPIDSGSMARHRYVLGDVFTDTPLAGNALAVFTDARDLPEESPQLLARETNLTRNGLRATRPARTRHARVRIFTPVRRVALRRASDPGLGIRPAGPMQLGEIALETGKGVVPVLLEREAVRSSSGGWRSRSRRSSTTRTRRCSSRFAVSRGPGAPGRALRQRPAAPLRDAPLARSVAALEPDFARLVRAPTVINASSIAGSGATWKTRMFAPAGGVAEDPATGSAAGPLALHLARHGRIPFGEEIEITQGVEIGRPSTLYRAGGRQRGARRGGRGRRLRRGRRARRVQALERITETELS